MDIYKITNKHSGKSYIGCSIYCGHAGEEVFNYKSQFIDQMVQFDGIDSYSFELLKVVEPQELDYWENYYIDKYNTMFPNGYNIQWNAFTYNQSTVAPAKIVWVGDDKLRNWTDIELTKPEIEQFEEWQDFIWKWEHDKIGFYKEQWSPAQVQQEKDYKAAQGIQLFHSCMQDILTYAPRTIDAYKQLKWKVYSMNKEIPSTINYQLPEITGELKDNPQFTAAQWQKYNELKETIDKVNNKEMCYDINKFGEIYLKGRTNILTFDEKYKCLKVEIDKTAHMRAKSYGEMFSKGILSKENVKIVDKNGQFVDFSQLIDKSSSIRAILFF